jgi:biopolymer transport protein ExbB
MFLLAESGRKDKALEILEKEPSIFASLFISILKEKSISDMEEAALLTGEEILFYLKRRLSLLSVLGSILPLMGLLGTVLGMIKVFTKVANAGNAADISILAGGIWEALITTAAGMIIAIPVILIYHFFNRAIEKISHSMQQKVSRLIMILKKQEHGNGEIQRQQ